MLVLKLHIVTIEDLVPQEHYLRRIDQVLNMHFVYEETRRPYSHRAGRPPIDPVILVRGLLLGSLEKINSMRELERKCQITPLHRWFIGVDLFDAMPDHSTLSQLLRRKPAFRKVFRCLFEEVVRQCVEAGLVSGRLIATDSTHVRSNASLSSERLVEVEETPGAYWEKLDE